MSKTNLTERTLDLLNALKGHTLTGRSLRELAKATNLPEPTASRILDSMIERSFVTKYDTGRYALSVRMLQIAQAHANETLRMQEKITELNQHIHAGAHK